MFQIDIRAPRSLLDLLVAAGLAATVSGLSRGGRSALSVTASRFDLVEATASIDTDRLDEAGELIWSWYCARCDPASARLVIQLRGGLVRSTWLRPTNRHRDIDRVLTALVDSGLESGLRVSATDAN